MGDKLKPCPCCGRSDVQDRSYKIEVDDYGNKGIMGKIICIDCGLNVESSQGTNIAIMRWNRRAKISE